jgi:hypothetical protein
MKHALQRERRAVTYLRIGSGVQSDAGVQVSAQRQACLRIARTYGATIVREYVDLGRPARLDQQPELRRLITDLSELQDVGYVVVADYARLADELTALDDLIRRLRSYSARVATLTGVQAAERFLGGDLLDRVGAWATGQEPAAPYSLALLRAVYRGLLPSQALIVTVSSPHGGTIQGHVAGIGSLLGIRTADGQLVEDLRAEWVIDADVHAGNRELIEERRNTQ